MHQYGRSTTVSMQANKRQFPIREERYVSDVLSMTDNEATRTTLVRTRTDCMRTRTRPKPRPDATRQRPKILASRPRWSRGL